MRINNPNTFLISKIYDAWWSTNVDQRNELCNVADKFGSHPRETVEILLDRLNKEGNLGNFYARIKDIIPI